MNIAIIGGGASGLVAAIEAARSGAKVTILEHTDSLGKKILSTGNGKCNYTNADLQAKYFHLEEDDLAYFVIKGIGYDGVKEFFEGLGIEAYVREGYTYPKSEQATAIRDALLLEIKRLGVTVCLNTKITRFQGVEKGFRLVGESHLYPLEKQEKMKTNKLQKEKNKKKNVILKTDKNEFTIHPFQREFHKVILATGSNAFSVSGSDGSGLNLLNPFDIKTKPFLPALCSLHVKEKEFFKLASGVRVKARLYLSIDGDEKKVEEGELQITDYGLSGIPIFQLSRHVSLALYEGRKVKIRVDILPEYAVKRDFLYERFQKTHLRVVGDFGLGLVNQKLWAAILKNAGIREYVLLDDEKVLQTLASSLEALTFTIIDTADADKAQVCTGGITLDEIDFHTLELKRLRGVHAVGELIDIDGICGGYNLTWAWCSGIFAARKAVCCD